MRQVLREIRQLTVSSLNATVRVELTGLNNRQIAELEKAWARCRPERTTSATESTAVSTVILSAAIDESTPSIEALGHQLSTRITLALIELARDEHLLLHACALAHPDTGSVIALVGPSGRGKTTAATTLGRKFGYVTDETVAVDADRTVWPYPKPLSVVQPRSTTKTQVGPDELGLLDVDGIAALRLEAIALLDRREDAPATPTLTPVGLADAIDELVPQISYLSSRHRPLVQLAETVAAVGGIQRLSYRDAGQLTDVVRTALDPGSEGHRGGETWREAATGSAATAGLRRADVADAIDNGIHLIVLNDDTVRVLGGIAPEIWRAADGVSLDALTAIVVAKYGAPPDGDADALVWSAVEELRSVRLLVGGDLDDGDLDGGDLDSGEQGGGPDGGAAAGREAGTGAETSGEL